MTLVLAILLFMLLNLVIFSYIKFNIFLFILLSICIPIIILISNLLISPISNIIKKSIIRKAKYKFQNIRGRTIVITVTGSYGKTTLKNFLEQFLKYSYKVQMIPGNINSTIGIANWILNNFKEGVDILIVEADSYKPKGIANTAKLVKTDIAIITNVGDQHLQRYKTKENLAQITLP
jgi:UDP-N-acetylmuramoyl-tripeptide--D-alanyl-D-alanine ligase